MAAKLETCTRVCVDSHVGHGCLRPRSANDVRTSKLRSQCSQRYS